VPPPEQADEIADLIATSLSAGGAPAQAVRDVAAVRSDLEVPLARLAFDLDRGQPGAALPPPLDRIALLLHTASEAGAPAGDALRRLATDLRADDLARALAAAERLPAHLTFPTALALLPAVLLAVGAPIVHAGLAAAGGV
jgi:pilus assembly protein TadC